MSTERSPCKFLRKWLFYNILYNENTYSFNDMFRNRNISFQSWVSFVLGCARYTSAITIPLKVAEREGWTSLKNCFLWQYSSHIMAYIHRNDASIFIVGVAKENVERGQGVDRRPPPLCKKILFCIFHPFIFFSENCEGDWGRAFEQGRQMPPPPLVPVYTCSPKSSHIFLKPSHTNAEKYQLPLS